MASRDLQPGALITERDITRQDYIAIPDGAIVKKEDIINRGVIAAIHRDAPFFDGTLAKQGVGAGFATIIPTGMRAFTVRVNEVVGVAGFAVAGMHVDILVAGTPPGGSQNTGPISRTLLQDISVLSAGQNYQKDAEGKPVLVQVVNLLVTPSQAEILNLATDHRIQLVLRNPTDNVITDTTGAATSNLFEGGAIRIQRPNISQDADAAPKPRRKPEVPVVVVAAPAVQSVAAPPPKTSVSGSSVGRGQKSDYDQPDRERFGGDSTMNVRIIDIALLAALAACASPLRAQAPEPSRILVGSGKTFVLDTASDIERISIASPETAEAVPVNTRSLMINGKAPGETSAIIWLSDGSRKEYDVRVAYSAAKLDAAKEQIRSEFGDSVQITGDSTAVYLTGTVKNVFASQRAQAIASSFGKVVNLLKVEIPPQEQEILLKVRFADVDRSKSMNLGINILGAPGGFPFNVTTGSNSPSRISSISGSTVGTGASASSTVVSLADALNILMFDPHANILATVQALEANNVLQILAEPNLLAMNGHVATFVAGGEFPFPTLQGGGGGVGQVTISFREFGIKLKFTPVITPRGTIRLHIAPEVSSLDFADALTVNGGTSTRPHDTQSGNGSRTGRWAVVRDCGLTGQTNHGIAEQNSRSSATFRFSENSFRRRPSAGLIRN